MAEEIKQGNNKFYVGEDENNPKAEITYKQVDNNEIEIDHTGVSDCALLQAVSYRGHQ